MISIIKNNIDTILLMLAIPAAWLFGGRQKSDNDAVNTIADIYKEFLVDFKTQVIEYKAQVAENKEQSELVMEELFQLKKSYSELQKQFNDIYLAYAKEVEKSENWEKLHRELKTKYERLLKAHNNLQTEFDKLKQSLI